MHSSGEGFEACDLSLAEDGGERQAAYRTLFRSELDAKAADDIRQALQLGMPLGGERFAETISARRGIRHNTGQGGRPNRPADEEKPQATLSQQDFGF